MSEGTGGDTTDQVGSMQGQKGEYPYYWRARNMRPERANERCRVVDKRQKNYFDSEVLVEFPDGEQVWANRTCVRRR